ncbi:protein Shroom3 isoform X2 [Hypomesus transpacificus]|uniref:protein Shroom3 isoform X2 n=1 Tax=Hypomesus transpacificus TaxID=137520 RepID=UPI001F08855F|nr:protein Shroom3 isoform X2 [Hypomesus transpacificus]
MESSLCSYSTVIQRGKSVFVEVRLQGGAPWGFTLKGGLEHGEALIISKVEEGGKGDRLEHPLQVGDRVVVINEVELSGFRQEAISLVKGSYKTLRLTVRRRSEPTSRPHSWHSTKLGEGQTETGMTQISQGSMGAPWHQAYHSSTSTTDLSSYETGYLRKSPDQYSSRGSMESLDHPHPAYSSCHQLSTSKSSNSIDHLHSKRDSAYSSFSTSSSIPEYLAAAPSFSKERSYSMETVPQRGGAGGGAEGMQQADIRYVRTVYDPQQGVSQEHEVSSASAALLRNSEARGGGGASRANHRGSSSSSGSSGGSSAGGGNPASNRHSVGPIWGQASSRSSYESLKGAPAPPTRSDSYAAIRNHERPNSWSSLEQARSQRALQKGSWHHSSGSVASGKGSYGAEGQLHTVIEKSPESSPTTKPKQGGFPSQPAVQSGRFMLPTGIYPVPLPEPHFAQMPTSCPSSSSVYPALAKERGQHHQGPLGVSMDEVALENGYQSIPPPPYSHSHSHSSQLHDFPQPRPPAQQAIDESQTKCALYRSHLRPGGADSQTPFPRQNHEGPAQGQGYRPCSAQSIGQERRDPYTPVQPRAEKPRYCQSPEKLEPHVHAREEAQLRHPVPPSAHPEPAPMPGSRVAQGQVAQAPRGGGGGGGVPPIQDSAHLRHPSDSGIFQQPKEHPLTRLENALAEVQRCASPESSSSQGSGQAARSLSVLEKVNRFERREQGKQRSHSASHSASHSNLGPPRPTQPHERHRSALSSTEDLRLMLERSNSPGGAYRSLSSSSYASGIAAQEDHVTQRRGSTDQPQHRSIPDVGLALQRSKSTFQLGGDENIRGAELPWREEFPWKEGLQDLLGSIHDTSYNRSYRDAQSKVLRSTSFRRRDLHVSVSSSNHPPPVPAKHLSLERRGPKTSPKPAVSVPPLVLAQTHTTSPVQGPATSPHTPKERHAITPEVRGISPPQLPSIPPVGPPSRIGGRKRLTMEQKKRSYSEPENMHEVGLSDAENSASSRKGDAQHFLFTDTSVADRRRMFEMAASRSVDPQAGASRPDLRQLQQDALADYVQRKKGWRPEGRHHRPRSAYLQPGASSAAADTRSLSSTASLMSLQEPDSDSFFGGERLCSTLPPGLQGFSYPGRSSVGPQAHLDPAPSRQNIQALASGPASVQAPDSGQALGPLRSLGLSLQHNAPFVRSTPAHSSGKSASAEDLLESSEERPARQHYRSRSSPSVEHSNQDVLSGELKMFGIFSTEPGLVALSADRTAEGQRQGCASMSQQRMERYMLNQGPSQSNTPVIRRERQRSADRQRAQSASGLAASVGLPCPFSPPGTSAILDWQASERLSQANLDAIAFPCLPQDSTAATSPESQRGGESRSSTASPVGERRGGSRGDLTRQISSDTSTSEETLKDFCLEAPLPPPKTTPPPSPPPPPPHRTGSRRPRPPFEASSRRPDQNPYAPRSLPSLRISESGLRAASPPAFTGEDYDEVFFDEPPPPSPPPPPPPLRETDLTEDFPPPPPAEIAPPPPPVWEEEAWHERQDNFSSKDRYILGSERNQEAVQSPHVAPTPPLPAPPVCSLTPEPEPQAPNSLQQEDPSTAACEAQESLGPESQLLSRRERSAEEQRVEALARQLVSRDSSLSPLLDAWAGKNTLDLMEDIFPNHTGGWEPWRRRGSSWLEDRKQDGGCSAGQVPVPEREMETDLDEEEADLNQKKVELLQALALSVAVLRGERQELSEEQARYRTLGSDMDALIQERCKPNQRDKYRMFIGDLDKIVNLLLSLCGRLARIDNSLSALDRQGENEDSSEGRESLQQKRQQLCSQQEDARELKENLDRRERVVLDILGGYLSGPQLRDYQHFVRMKPALLIRQRHLDELIRQGEEQVKRLSESLPPEHHIPPPCSTATGPGPSLTVRSTTVTSL